MNINQNITYTKTVNSALPVEQNSANFNASQKPAPAQTNTDKVTLSHKLQNSDALNTQRKPAQTVASDMKGSVKEDKSAFSDWNRATQDKAYTLEQLKNNWLAESERMVEKYYGLKAQGDNTLTVRFNDDPDASYIASVSYFPDQDDELSRATNQILTLVTSEFPQGQDQNGAYKPFYGDRIVAHEMTHAIMGQTMDMDSLGEWFKEGTAELIHGGDERLLYQLSIDDGNLENGYNAKDIANFANDTAFFDQWNSSSAHYAQGYLAVRFMHQDIVSNGGDGIKDVMTFLSDEQVLSSGKANLNEALSYLSEQNLSTYASEDEFKNAYQKQAASYLLNINLMNEDTGAIGGYDVDKGDVKTAENVVDNSTFSSSNDPLKGYKEVIFQDKPSTYSAYT